MSDIKPCGHCGRLCGDYDGGWAAVSDKDGNMVQVCHPNVLWRPDCYRLITIYHEPLGSRKRQTG